LYCSTEELLLKALIISDIHGNLAAIKAVLRQEPDADLIVCLGDLVDYGPKPAECIALVREVADIIVQGNHDYAVGTSADPQCSAEYAHLADVTEEYTLSVLSLEDRSYLANLPVEARFMIGSDKVTAVHAAPTDPRFEYRPPETSDDDWQKEIVAGGSPNFLLLGHTHLPLIKKLGSTTVVNVGSVGQPKDGDPRAAYVVIENGVPVQKRAEYDIGATIAALHDTTLEKSDIDALAKILRSGG
jgi:putative phosphoesterase